MTTRTMTIRPGRRRWGAVLAAAGLLCAVALGSVVLPPAISGFVFFGLLAPIIGLVVLARRIRRDGSTEQHTQLRLLFGVLAVTFTASALLAAGVLAAERGTRPGMTLPAAVGAVADDTAGPLFWYSWAAGLVIAAAVLIAARRRRWWAAERILSRGLVATVVVVLTGGGYLVVEALVARLADPGTGLAPALAATLAALLFLPCYLRVEQLADRLLYGSSPTPHRVLAALADITALSRSGTADTPDLAAIPEAVARGLGARSCRLTVVRPGLRDRSYTWSATGRGADADEPADEYTAVPIMQGAQRVGAIEVDRAALAGLRPHARHLLDDIVGSLGAVLQLSRLGIERERQLRAALAHAEDIATSRRQAVAEMDSERRAIERNLHDGAQHHLVSLRLTLGLAEHAVATGRLDQARDRLTRLVTQVDTTADVLAETATGVCSITLAERGLVAALNAELSGMEPPLHVDTGDSGDGSAAGAGAGLDTRRFPAPIEAAVYFCCLEAVNNARKHAPGAAVEVRIREVPGALRFAVSDRGPGLPAGTGPGAGPAGRGLRNMTARIAAAGGTVSVHSAPGAGTTVEGVVPLPAEERHRSGSPGVTPSADRSHWPQPPQPCHWPQAPRPQSPR